MFFYFLWKPFPENHDRSTSFLNNYCCFIFLELSQEKHDRSTFFLNLTGDMTVPLLSSAQYSIWNLGMLCCMQFDTLGCSVVCNLTFCDARLDFFRTLGMHAPLDFLNLLLFFPIENSFQLYLWIFCWILKTLCSNWKCMLCWILGAAVLHFLPYQTGVPLLDFLLYQTKGMEIPSSYLIIVLPLIIVW